MNSLNINTTWGTIRLTQMEGAVIRCALPRLKTVPPRPFAINGYRSIAAVIRTFPATEIPDGTPFQQAVWRELQKIPRGQTRTYGEIARRIGRPRAARAVGAACGANPLQLFIPCQRAVAAGGRPGGFSAGIPWKTLLLEMEGPKGLFAKR